jgi:predicted  nucleic acid-binding Zn-ribbon protein
MMAETDALLELQSLDLDIRRSSKRLDELPEKRAILEVRAKQREVEALRAKADVLLGKLRRDFSAHQDELASLNAKIEAEQAKLMETSDHRTVTARDKIEMESLQLMERVEKATAQGTTVVGALEQLADKHARLVAEFQSAGGELQTHISDAQARRDGVAKSISADLLKRYEAACTAKSGVGVGALEKGTCTACRMVLPAERVKELTAGPSIATCPHCHRLIVVEPEDAQ